MAGKQPARAKVKTSKEAAMARKGSDGGSTTRGEGRQLVGEIYLVTYSFCELPLRVLLPASSF